jgi:hypothetical protein
VRRGIISVAIFVAFVAIFTISRHDITSSTTTTTTNPPVTTTSSSSTTTTSLAATTCLASDFSGVYNEGEGAAGTIYASVTLTKTTGPSCTLIGWPIITLSDRLGAVLKSSAVDVPSSGNDFQFSSARANEKPSALTLGANSTTTFSLAYSDVPTGNTACESAVTVSVQFVAGGASVAVTPQYAVQPCNDGQLWLSPFY